MAGIMIYQQKLTNKGRVLCWAAQVALVMRPVVYSYHRIPIIRNLVYYIAESSLEGNF